MKTRENVCKRVKRLCFYLLFVEKESMEKRNQSNWDFMLVTRKGRALHVDIQNQLPGFLGTTALQQP